MTLLATEAPWLPRWLSFLSGVPTIQRKRRVLVAIQAYVDESEGKGKAPLFVFSALMAEAETWAVFSDRWAECLKESPRIAYFKMDEAAGCDGQFYGFSNSERDRKLIKLCRAINDADLRELSCGLDITDFKITTKNSPKPISEPYFFPFHAIIAMVGFDLVERHQAEPFEIFFDENRIFGPRAKNWYPVIREMVDEPIRSLMPPEPFFRSDIHTMPLQAADLTAWIVRMTNSEGMGEFAWLQQELRLTTSPHSLKLDSKTLHWLDDPANAPSIVEKMIGPLEAYRKAFGHDWPPRTKPQIKKHRGR